MQSGRSSGPKRYTTLERRDLLPRWSVGARYVGARRSSFLDFVLLHYVRVGVEELGQDKLTPLLRLKYRNSLSDAIADLGSPAAISDCFIAFQRWLYVAEAA